MGKSYNLMLISRVIYIVPLSGREEEESLRDKIRADHERALQEAKEKLRKSREELQAEIQTEKTKVMEDLKKKDLGPKPLPPVPMPKVVGVSDGEPPELDVKEKRDKIREVRYRSLGSLQHGSIFTGMFNTVTDLLQTILGVRSIFKTKWKHLSYFIWVSYT